MGFLKMEMDICVSSVSTYLVRNNLLLNKGEENDHLGICVSQSQINQKMNVSLVTGDFLLSLNYYEVLV